MILQRWLATPESGWTLLVRLMIGLVVFAPEGLQKLLFPAILGAGRFAKIGIPWPHVFGPVVGVTEFACGVLIILGLATRLAAIPLIVIMVRLYFDQGTDLARDGLVAVPCRTDGPVRALEHAA